MSDSHHPLSHQQDEAAKLERLHMVNECHFQQFAYLVSGQVGGVAGWQRDDARLDAVPLWNWDHTHFHDDLPIALIVGKNAGIKGGHYA